MVLLAAIFADPINLKRVPGSEVVILAANLLLEIPDLLRKEFDRTAAIGAHHVMMTASVVLMFVAGDSVMESNFAGQATLGQKFERTVDGGVPDTGVSFLYKAVEFVGRQMIASLQKSAQNGIPLSGLL